MSQQIQELIDKIKTEGVQQAEEKAKEVEQQTKVQAERIIDDAKARAEQLVLKAKEEQSKLQEAVRASLKQAARDMLLDLRKEIEAILKRIVTNEVKQVLAPEDLAKLINEVAKGFLSKESDVKDLSLIVSSSDLKKLKDGFMEKLKEGIKQPMTFQSADDIDGGFTISFDDGKSFFDFTDVSLVDYLSNYLNAEVSALLAESFSSE